MFSLGYRLTDLYFSGKWVGNMPACVPFDFCERPPSISHGFMVTSPENIYRIWTEVYYECHQGYQMKGVKSLKVGFLHTFFTHYSKSQIFVQKFNFDKTPTFSRVFQPIKSTIFFGKSKLNFWTKNEDFEQCDFSNMSINHPLVCGIVSPDGMLDPQRFTPMRSPRPHWFQLVRLR